MSEMFQSSHPGVRYRESKTRKHGIKPDRYFFIRYKVSGKGKEEGAGWASEGMTAQKAATLLATIKNNIRTGARPQSLAEMRELDAELRGRQEREQQRAELAATTFDEFWEQQYLPHAKMHKTPQTIKTEVGYYTKWVFPHLGKTPLQSITPVLVENLAAKATVAGKSAATVRHLLAIVSQVWNMAKIHGLVDGESPCGKVKKPRKDNRRMRFLTPEEARRLLDALAARSPDTHDTALLSLFCGLRAGEIHNLTWGDVNFDGGTLYIRDPKNKHSRHAFMTDEVRHMLMNRQDGQAKIDFVIPAENGGQRKWVSDTFERVVTALGFNDEITDARQKIVFHSLRHTFASWLVQDGTPLFTVAELMGHTTLEMTKRYSHLAPDTMRKAAMGLQGKLG